MSARSRARREIKGLVLEKAQEALSEALISHLEKYIPVKFMLETFTSAFYDDFLEIGQKRIFTRGSGIPPLRLNISSEFGYTELPNYSNGSVRMLHSILHKSKGSTDDVSVSIQVDVKHNSVIRVLSTLYDSVKERFDEFDVVDEFLNLDDFTEIVEDFTERGLDILESYYENMEENDYEDEEYEFDEDELEDEDEDEDEDGAVDRGMRRQGRFDQDEDVFERYEGYDYDTDYVIDDGQIESRVFGSLSEHIDEYVVTHIQGALEDIEIEDLLEIDILLVGKSKFEFKPGQITFEENSFAETVDEYGDPVEFRGKNVLSKSYLKMDRQKFNASDYLEFKTDCKYFLKIESCVSLIDTRKYDTVTELYSALLVAERICISTVVYNLTDLYKNENLKLDFFMRELLKTYEFKVSDIDDAKRCIKLEGKNAVVEIVSYLNEDKSRVYLKTNRTEGYIDSEGLCRFTKNRELDKCIGTIERLPTHLKRNSKVNSDIQIDYVSKTSKPHVGIFKTSDTATVVDKIAIRFSEEEYLPPIVYNSQEFGNERLTYKIFCEGRFILYENPSVPDNRNTVRGEGKGQFFILEALDFIENESEGPPVSVDFSPLIEGSVLIPYTKNKLPSEKVSISNYRVGNTYSQRARPSSVAYRYPYTSVILAENLQDTFIDVHINCGLVLIIGSMGAVLDQEKMSPFLCIDKGGTPSYLDKNFIETYASFVEGSPYLFIYIDEPDEIKESLYKSFELIYLKNKSDTEDFPDDRYLNGKWGRTFADLRTDMKNNIEPFKSHFTQLSTNTRPKRPAFLISGVSNIDLPTYTPFRTIPYSDESTYFFAKDSKAKDMSLGSDLNDWQKNAIRLSGLFLNPKRSKEFKNELRGLEMDALSVLPQFPNSLKDLVASNLKYISEDMRIRGANVMPANLVSGIYAYELACAVYTRWGEHSVNNILPIMNLDAHIKTYTLDYPLDADADILDILYASRRSIVNQILQNRYYANVNNGDNRINFVDFNKLGQMNIVQYKRIYCYVDLALRPLSILSNLVVSAKEIQDKSSRQNPFIGIKKDTGRFGEFWDAFLGYLEARTELICGFFLSENPTRNLSTAMMVGSNVLITSIRKDNSSKSMPVVLISKTDTSTSPVMQVLLQTCTDLGIDVLFEKFESKESLQSVRKFLLRTCRGETSSVELKDVIKNFGDLHQELFEEYTMLEDFYPIPLFGQTLDFRGENPNHTATSSKFEFEDKTYPKFEFLGVRQMETSAEKSLANYFTNLVELGMYMGTMENVFKKLLNEDCEADENLLKLVDLVCGSKKILPNLIDLKSSIINATISKGSGAYAIALNCSTSVKHMAEDSHSSYFEDESCITAKLSGHTLQYQAIWQALYTLSESSDRKTSLNFDDVVRLVSDPVNLNNDEAVLGLALRPKSRFPNETYTSLEKPANINSYEYETLLYPSEYATLLNIVKSAYDEIIALSEQKAEELTGKSVIYKNRQGFTVQQAGVVVSKKDPSVLVEKSEDSYVKALIKYSLTYNFCIGQSQHGYTTSIRYGEIEVFNIVAKRKLLGVVTVSVEESGDVHLYETNAENNTTSCTDDNRVMQPDYVAFFLKYFADAGLNTFDFIFASVDININSPEGLKTFEVHSENEAVSAEKKFVALMRQYESEIKMSDIEVYIKTPHRGWRYAASVYKFGRVMQRANNLPDDFFFSRGLNFVLGLLVKDIGEMDAQYITTTDPENLGMSPGISNLLRGSEDINNVELARIRRSRG